MAFKYSITNLQFSDGQTIELSGDDIVVLVGPNNAGKSAALREVVTLLDSRQGSDPSCKVVRSLAIDVTQDEQQLREFLAQLEPVPGQITQVGRMGNSSQVQYFLDHRENANVLRQALRAFTTYLVTTESRLQVTQPATSIDFGAQQKSHPFHYLYDDATLEAELSGIFSKAFGVDLIVDRFGGSVIPLHVGRRPLSAGPYDASATFRSELRKLPTLNTQGDGMRAFVGCLMWAYVADYHLIFIDEPEAFLHPPQARLLGRTLAKKKKHERQFLLATHSGDFLRGLLDAGPQSLRVLRIVRDGEVNCVKELKPSEVKALWADPILRQSNTLDGLFHSMVILCEADGDCQFYSSIANALAEAVEGRVSPDAMFIHCGGKDRMPKVVNALRAVGVPLRVIADFDVLREEKPLRQIFEGLGGVWKNIQADWRIVRDSISARKAQLDAQDFRKAIQESLGKIGDASVVADQVLEEVRDHARKASAWSYAKEVGEAFIPKGDAYRAYQQLHANLASMGLSIVAVGELESFCKSISMHGPAWVAEVSKRNLANDPDLAEARTFVESIFWPTPSTSMSTLAAPGASASASATA